MRPSKKFFFACGCGKTDPHDHAINFKAEEVPGNQVVEKVDISLEELKADPLMKKLTRSFQPE